MNQRASKALDFGRYQRKGNNNNAGLQINAFRNVDSGSNLLNCLWVNHSFKAQCAVLHHQLTPKNQEFLSGSSSEAPGTGRIMPVERQIVQFYIYVGKKPKILVCTSRIASTIFSQA